MIRWYDLNRRRRKADIQHSEQGDNEKGGEGKVAVACIPTSNSPVDEVAEGFLRPWVFDWVEWLDMTDGIGYPVLMGFIAGSFCPLPYPSTFSLPVCLLALFLAWYLACLIFAWFPC